MFLKKVDGTVGSLLARLWPRPRRSGSLPSQVSSVLLIRPGGIGDAVLLIPVITHLREKFPSSRIDVLAEKRNEGAFALCSGIDRVLCYDRPGEFWKILKSRYDVVIDSEQWHYLSALAARTIRSKVKIGFGTNERKKLFTHPVDYSHADYEQQSFLSLLKPLGIDLPVNVCPPFLSLPAAAQVSADVLLGTLLHEPFVVLFPGASISERCWGAEKFNRLARRFIDDGHPVVVVGGKEDVATGTAIVAGTSALNLAGKTSLLETAGVLNRAMLLVSGDSGVLHVGVGLGTPTVSLFGPGIEDKWAPQSGSHVVINHKLPCSPCTLFGTTPPCPIGARCIQGISVDEVWAAARRIFSCNSREGNV